MVLRPLHACSINSTSMHCNSVARLLSVDVVMYSGDVAAKTGATEHGLPLR